MFIGTDFCGGDMNSITATKEDIITKLQITNGIYDTLFGSENINASQLDWDFYTRLYAKFQNNLSAGNVNFSAKTISAIRVKRRKSDEHLWFDLCDIPINANDDFNFEVFDKYAQGNTEYYYALVPISNSISGNMIKNHILSTFDGFYLLDRDISYHIFLDAKISTSINKPNSTVTVLGKKYPYYISNGNVNYKSGTLSFGLAPIHNCEIDELQGQVYREQFEEWLFNGSPKLLKSWTGQLFLINITDTVSINYDDWRVPEYSVNFVEIGSATSQEDMYLNGLIDIDTFLKKGV